MFVCVSGGGVQRFCSCGSGKPEDSMEGERERERERERGRGGGVRERGSLKCDSQSRGEGYTAKIFFSTAARRNCSGLQQNSWRAVSSQQCHVTGRSSLHCSKGWCPLWSLSVKTHTSFPHSGSLSLSLLLDFGVGYNLKAPYMPLLRLVAASANGNSGTDACHHAEWKSWRRDGAWLEKMPSPPNYCFSLSSPMFRSLISPSRRAWLSDLLIVFLVYHPSSLPPLTPCVCGLVRGLTF